MQQCTLLKNGLHDNVLFHTNRLLLFWLCYLLLFQCLLLGQDVADKLLVVWLSRIDENDSVAMMKAAEEALEAQKKVSST